MRRANVAPFARFIMAMTSAFFFVRSEVLPAGFLAARAFFAGFAFLLALRSPLVGAAATSRLMLSDSIVNCAHWFLLTAKRSSHSSL